MKKFNYIVTTNNGVRHKGEIWGENYNSVIARLTHQGYLVISVKQVKQYKKLLNRNIWTVKNIIYFSSQLSILSSAGLSVSKILSMLKNNKKNKLPIDELKEYIQRGFSCSEALVYTGFPTIATAMVKSGEVSGDIANAFFEIQKYYEQEKSMKDKLIQIIIYPSFVLSLLFLFLFVAVYFIFPTFAEVFQSMNTPLPPIMKMLLAIKDNLEKYGVYEFIIASGLIGGGYSVFVKSTKLIMMRDKTFWKLGKNNMCYGGYAYTRVFSVIALLLGAGVSLLNALKITQPLWGNKYVSKQIEEIIKDVTKGILLDEAFKNNNVGTELFYELIKAGQASGELEVMFKRAGSYYKKEVEQSFKKLEIIMEPILMSIIGVIIGSVVILIMIPLFEAIQTIGGL